MQSNEQQGTRTTPRFRSLIPVVVWSILGSFGIWLFYSSYAAVRDGYITDRRSYTVRSERPTSFWLSVGIRISLGMMIGGLAVWPLIADDKPRTRTTQTGAGRRFFQVRYVVSRSMQRSPAIHFGECTICGQGQLLAVKSVDTGDLLVMCDDCESQWSSPDEVHSSKHVLMEEVRAVDADLDEIVAAGWERHPRAQGLG